MQQDTIFRPSHSVPTFDNHLRRAAIYAGQAKLMLRRALGDVIDESRVRALEDFVGVLQHIIESIESLSRGDCHADGLGSTPSNATQRGRILNRLISARGAEVPLPEIAARASQYGTRILELRRMGLVIQNRVEMRDRVRYSWFRLVLGACPTTSPAAVSDAKREQISHVVQPSLFSEAGQR